MRRCEYDTSAPAEPGQRLPLSKKMFSGLAPLQKAEVELPKDVPGTGRELG
jgi:hypothetical protein